MLYPKIIVYQNIFLAWDFHFKIYQNLNFLGAKDFCVQTFFVIRILDNNCLDQYFGNWSSSCLKQNILLHCLAQCHEPKSRYWRPNSCCHTRFHLGFSVKLRIWQVSAWKMEPRSGYIFCQEPASQPPTECLRACISVYTGYRMIYHIIFKGFTLKKCMKKIEVQQ